MCTIGYSDPVKAERYEDGILHARERMQRIQDEKASEHAAKMEEVCLEWVTCAVYLVTCVQDYVLM